MIPAAPDARLPDGFVVRLATGVRRRPGGALLGGSPLRLVRLAPRARALLTGDRLVVRDPTTAELAARLLDAGLASPDLASPDLSAVVGPVDVTVVVPVRDRPEGLARLLVALRDDPATTALPVIVVDDGSVVPVAVRRARVLRHEVSRGPAAARNAGLRAVTTPFVAFLDSDCVPVTGWLDALRPHLADPRLAVVAPRIVALRGGPGWLGTYETAVSALDMGPAPAAVAPLSAVSYVPSAALLVRRAALGDGFDETMRVAEDVDLVWRLAAAGWRLRYEPAGAVAHDHPARTVAWLRRRAFYGTGAALLAARHGSAVAPVVLAPESGLAWALALFGGRRGRAAAAGLLAVTAVRLARRLGRPGEPLPLGFAAGLVLRGQAASGRALARAVTRHHWPLALAASGSRRARRGVLVVAVGDALAAWWPHRHRVGPVRFAAARRLEDLAYGAGLWWGALRSRSPRALLPARPPRLTRNTPAGRNDRSVP
jgi:mycofactocin system glycosyltransferase